MVPSAVLCLIFLLGITTLPGSSVKEDDRAHHRSSAAHAHAALHAVNGHENGGGSSRPASHLPTMNSSSVAGPQNLSVSKRLAAGVGRQI
ncbi:hypothetical protein GSI_13313 [Ganoderma sinense ZZ0214-1]|uniref:Transporter n=1 Tax=Ganoderma sinense ZZ0214-1 TaxID=1077348 RepID=A0A2G8RV93_9APHY|nr:hypothetical protein GSI_13313 [Ganoderma sinense ZZ0214-1]